MPKVLFVETRQIRRNHKTVQWRAGETYDLDPEMQPMIDIGHARVLDEPKPEPEAAKKASDKDIDKPKQVPDPAKAPK